MFTSTPPAISAACCRAPTPSAPRLLIGSHLDTVANAGAFDGMLGVVLGVALAEEMFADTRTAGKGMPFAIEVIGFSEEEGVRFAKPFLGSLALIGELDAATLARTDRNGITVADAIRNFGLDPAELPAAVLDDSAFAYLEFHIEQGPVLESEGLRPWRRRRHRRPDPHGVHLHRPGQPRRHHAYGPAAPRCARRRRRSGSSRSSATPTAIPGLVATVGKVEVPSAAGNVIPGSSSPRSTCATRRTTFATPLCSHYIDYAQTAAAARGVTVTHTTSIDQPAVPMGSGAHRPARCRRRPRHRPRAAIHHQRRRPRRHDRRPPRARRHALPALARRAQPPPRRGRAARRCRSRTRHRGGVPAHLAR